MTLDQIKQTCQLHHSAIARGYVSRKGDRVRIVPYTGRYGTGYKVMHAWDQSTRFCPVDYYLELPVTL